MSTTTRTREMNYSAFERSGIGLRPAARGLVVTTDYFWELLRRSWLCKYMGLVFAMGQTFLRKLGFAKNGNLGKT